MRSYISIPITLLSLTALLNPSLAQNATSPSYAPSHVPCPSDVQWLRPAQGLNPDEAAWVAGRKRVVLDAMTEYLERLRMDDFDVRDYARKLRDSSYANVPTLAWATSGGGYRSAYTGTGGIRALDARLPAAVEQKIGGLLQSLTYIAGQSGGTFPTFSFPLYGFPTADEIVQFWQPQIVRSGAPNDTQYTESENATFLDIAAKAESGFNVSLSDFFARGFASEFVPGPGLGKSTTLSSLLELDSFQSFSMPMPMGLASEVRPGDMQYFGLQVPSTNGSANLYELTPFEFGSWTGSKAFTPMKWIGTRLVDGSPVNSESCVNGFDNAGFMIASAASAENFWLIEGFSNDTIAPFSKRSKSASSLDRRQSSQLQGNYIPQETSAETGELVEAFKAFGLNATSVTYAPWPNPFYGYESADSSSREDLQLVDATEVGQAVPFWGLIQPARTADLIFAWEDDGDAPNSWNNGTNLRDTYLAALAANLSFPVVPPVNTIINKGFNRRPTLFGCNANLTTKGDDSGPIVVYVANAPYSAYTNYSAVDQSIGFVQMNEIFVNSFNLLTGGNGTLESDWPVCLGCAAIDRSLARIHMNRTAQCARCMQTYCWDGGLDERNPEIFNPSLALQPNLTFAQWNQTNPF